MKRLNVRRPDALYAEIENAARIRNVAKSEIVRERLAGGKIAKGSLWSRMENLVIHDESLPQDLSTNKKYFGNYGKSRSARG